MDKAHIEQIYGKYSDTVFRLAYSIVKDISEAEDITSDVFVKFFTYEKDFENEEHEKAWLIRTTINKCKDMCGLINNVKITPFMISCNVSAANSIRGIAPSFNKRLWALAP